MCRNIRVLAHFEPPTTEAEMLAAALQYVRKITGTTRPSKENQEAFDRAVEEITAITRRLVSEEYIARGAPRTREVEARRARERGQRREARARLRPTGEPT